MNRNRNMYLSAGAMPRERELSSYFTIIKTSRRRLTVRTPHFHCGSQGSTPCVGRDAPLRSIFTAIFNTNMIRTPMNTMRKINAVITAAAQLRAKHFDAGHKIAGFVQGDSIT